MSLKISVDAAVALTELDDILVMGRVGASILLKTLKNFAFCGSLSFRDVLSNVAPLTIGNSNMSLLVAS